MNDKQLQKLLRLSDEQVENLRWQNGTTVECSNPAHRQCGGDNSPSTAPLLELVRQSLIDGVGEDAEQTA